MVTSSLLHIIVNTLHIVNPLHIHDILSLCILRLAYYLILDIKYGRSRTERVEDAIENLFRFREDNYEDDD